MRTLDAGYTSPVMRYDQRAQLLVIAQRDPVTGAIESQIPAENVVLRCRVALADAPAAAELAAGGPTTAEPAAPGPAAEPAPAAAAPAHVSVFI